MKKILWQEFFFCLFLIEHILIFSLGLKPRISIAGMNDVYIINIFDVYNQIIF